MNKRRSVLFPPHATRQKSRSATWLSPVAQPQVLGAKPLAAPEPPHDQRHKRFIVNIAAQLEALIRENETYFGHSLQESFAEFGLMARDKPGVGTAAPAALQRSLDHLPITPLYEPLQDNACGTLRADRRGTPITSTLRYTWLEEVIFQTSTPKPKPQLMTMQVRHHSRLESFHENARPVYCINLKSVCSPYFDLRMLMLVNCEWAFLERACAPFARSGDFNHGMPVFDQLRRIFVDERVIRRAAYAYSMYQRLCFERRGSLHQGTLDRTLRHAHFLVFRSHLPEVSAAKLETYASAARPAAPSKPGNTQEAA